MNLTHVQLLWFSSGLVALAAGGLIRWWDRKVRVSREIDPKRLTLIQVLYSALLAYPFCVLYVIIDQNF